MTTMIKTTEDIVMLIDVIKAEMFYAKNWDDFLKAKQKFEDFAKQDWISLDKLKEALDNEQINNPYSESVFPKPNPNDLEKLTIYCRVELGFPIDRISAYMMRIARKNLIDDLRQKFFQASPLPVKVTEKKERQ